MTNLYCKIASKPLVRPNPQINVSIAIQYPSANFDRINHPAIAFNFSQAYLTLNATLMSYDLSRGKTACFSEREEQGSLQLNERFCIFTVIFNFPPLHYLRLLI